MDHRSRLAFLHDLDRQPAARLELFKANIDGAHSGPASQVQARRRPARYLAVGIVDFSIINAAFHHRAGSGFPGGIGADHHGTSIFTSDLQLAKQGKAVAINRIFEAFETEASFIPAVTQHRPYHIWAALQQRSDIVGLVLDPVIIGIVTGGQALVAHSFPVNLQLV